jgi:hypothetical protein
MKTYRYGWAPFSSDLYDRIDEDEATEEQKANAVAIEICDGGGGRCKCPSRCVRYIVGPVIIP